MKILTRLQGTIVRSARVLPLCAVVTSTNAFCMRRRNYSADSEATIVEETRYPLEFLTKEEIRLQTIARTFAQDVLLPQAASMDRAAAMPSSVIQGLFDNGLMGIEIEKEYGGTGSTFVAACLVVEELAKAEPGVAVLCDIQNTLNNTLIRTLGTKEQKEKYLPRLAKDLVSSFCLSEPGSGSDAFAMKTRAVADGDDFVLNGTKQWISNSVEAGVFLVMANADPSKGYRGITTFLVDRDTPGLSVGKKERKLGIRASSTCPVTFEDVRIPKENILGEYGKGYKYAISMLNEGRIGIAAQMVGLAEGVLELSESQFTEECIRENARDIKQLKADITAARLLFMNAARLREGGQPFVREAAMAKLYGSQVAERAASSCVDWCGSMGATSSFLAEKFYRDSKIGAIYEGTSNIQLTTIAKFDDSVYQ
eukprot:CFRG8515T1